MSKRGLQTCLVGSLLWTCYPIKTRFGLGSFPPAYCFPLLSPVELKLPSSMRCCTSLRMVGRRVKVATPQANSTAAPTRMEKRGHLGKLARGSSHSKTPPGRLFRELLARLFRHWWHQRLHLPRSAHGSDARRLEHTASDVDPLLELECRWRGRPRNEQVTQVVEGVLITTV